ncbi:MAG: hypothetical protein QOH21_482 [Acidobacteriota bacterium]|nr:hypothetical protein [Acidobacteriota bacterium]
MRGAALLLVAMLAAANATAGTGKMIIINADKPGTGFNDSTPVAPVGGNAGTTLGQQRMNVFQAAAYRWSNTVDTSVDILVSATFTNIPGCTQTDAVLGQAAPQEFVHTFPNAPRDNVWYPIALANKLAGHDLREGKSDIFVQFNASVDNATCLGDVDWYYGLDNQHGSDMDLYVVVLHELAHGLGISGATTAPDFKDNRPSVFDTHVLDVSTGFRWDQMSTAQRELSAVNTGNLVWDGEAVRRASTGYLEPLTTLTVTNPAPIAKNYDIGTADFGPAPARTSLAGRMALAVDPSDEAGALTTDGCSAFTNAAALDGRIAVVDRGNCTFSQKARNAQAAGAAGLVIVDNSRESCIPPSMALVGENDVRIPTISISAIDGDGLKAQLEANVVVDARLRVDPLVRAGATEEGYVRLYAPCTIEGGSSIHHWDVMASPNLLMEPDVNSDLLHGMDITMEQLIDMGWQSPPRTGRRILKR